jgi:hypothetical protein
MVVKTIKSLCLTATNSEFVILDPRVIESNYLLQISLSGKHKVFPVQAMKAYGGVQV